MSLSSGLNLQTRVLKMILQWAALGCVAPALAFDSGSTGADGALNPAFNTEIQLPPSGVLNYTTINIPTGVTVRFKKNALNTPVVLLASGNVTITGVINVSGSSGRDTGSTGDGNRADDGMPGEGGPGGFDGGRGGAADSEQRAAVIEGGAGQGPGGGQGGRVISTPSYTTGSGRNSCKDNRYSSYEAYGLGAGYAANGPDAYFSHTSWLCNGTSPAAQAYGSSALQPLLGGSGGGGGRANATIAGAGGGGGGGAILIASSGTIAITGQVIADAGNAGRAANGYYGGGGSGGAIRLVAASITGNGTVYARRGCGLSSGGNANCDGYIDAGSPGRIRMEADSFGFAGTSNPLYSAEAPSPVAAATLPTIRISSVAGAAVPEQPTGIGDLVLPGDVANPVTVVLTTVNVPLGSTVQLRAVPANGLPVEATSSGVAGSQASGTASASISLPQGPSRLEARITFAVTVAMGEALSRFAGNERVDAVEIVASMSGRPEAVLITVSGRRHPVPMSTLQAAASAG